MSEIMVQRVYFGEQGRSNKEPPSTQGGFAFSLPIDCCDASAHWLPDPYVALSARSESSRDEERPLNSLHPSRGVSGQPPTLAESCYP